MELRSKDDIISLRIYYFQNWDLVTVENYNKLQQAGTTAVFLNPDKPSGLIMDVGPLPTPPEMLSDFLSTFVEEDALPGVLQAVQGLSLKETKDILQLTMARSGTYSPSEIRSTRLMLNGNTPGLESVDTHLDFYVMPKEADHWLTLNTPYFLNPKTPQKLVPRGVLAVGEPGVGKSTLAQAIAGRLNIPLFRLDFAGNLTRWLGESENRITRNLQIIEQNAPCVWLLDEVEKLFGGSGDEGTTQRILSQILWWLQYHKSRVITVMTTNNLSLLPKELYRPGRIDRVITIEKLKLDEAKLFASKVFTSILGVPPILRQQKTMRELLDKKGGPLAHADVVEFVADLIKEKKWVDAEENKKIEQFSLH